MRKWLSFVGMCRRRSGEPRAFSRFRPRPLILVGINWYSVTPSFGDFNLAPCGTPGLRPGIRQFEPGSRDIAQERPARRVLRVIPPASSRAPAIRSTGGRPSAGEVAYEGTTIQSLPVMQNMFTPQGHGFRTTTRFVVRPRCSSPRSTSAPEAVRSPSAAMTTCSWRSTGSWSTSVGGIHPFGTTSTYDVTPGTYSMEVFYADRHVIAAYADIQLQRRYHRPASPSLATWALLLIRLRRPRLRRTQPRSKRPARAGDTYNKYRERFTSRAAFGRPLSPAARRRQSPRRPGRQPVRAAASRQKRALAASGDTSTPSSYTAPSLRIAPRCWASAARLYHTIASAEVPERSLAPVRLRAPRRNMACGSFCLAARLYQSTACATSTGNAPSALVNRAEPDHRPRMPSLGRLLVPIAGRGGVRLHALAVFIKRGDGEHRLRLAVLCGVQVPLARLGVVFRRRPGRCRRAARD